MSDQNNPNLTEFLVQDQMAEKKILKKNKGTKMDPLVSEARETQTDEPEILEKPMELSNLNLEKDIKEKNEL